MLRHGQQQRRGRDGEELDHTGIAVDLPHLQVCTTRQQAKVVGGGVQHEFQI